MVTDRFMLIVFSTVFAVGTFFILARSPYFMDKTEPLKLQIATKPLRFAFISLQLYMIKEN
jgi:hypothetical protein